MPVTVHIPIRVRLSQQAARRNPDLESVLAPALRRGLGQALQRTRKHVFEPRGGYALAAPLVPQIFWLDSAGLVGPRRRDDLEEQIREIIRECLAEHALTISAEATEVLPRSPRERVRRGQLRRGRYRVHSYEGEPQEADIEASQPEESHEEPAGGGLTMGWFVWNGESSSLSRAIDDILLEHYEGQRPARLGLICRIPVGPGGSYCGVYLKLQWMQDGSYTFEFGSAILAEQFLSIKEKGTEKQNVPPLGTYTQTTIGAFSGPEQLRELVRPQLFAIVGLALDPAADESAVDQDRRNTTEAELDRCVQTYGGYTDSVLAKLTTPQAVDFLIVVPRAMLLGEASWTLHGAWELTELGGAGGRRGGNGDGGEQTTGSPMTETAEADDGRPGSFYPVIQVGDEPVPLDLSAFLGEPSVNEIGEPGEALKRLIKRISYRLEMPEGEYCGAFLIAAAQVIGARASLVGIAETTRGATPRQVQPGSGNLGDVDLQPEQTPAVRLLRFIAGVCPLVTELSRLMGSVYALPYVRSLIRGRYNNHHIGWMLHFHMEHTPAMRDSIAHLYMRACQVVMLQLLRASRVEIDKRLANFDRYFVLFESLMTGLVASEAKLQRMRELLNQIEAATLSSGQAVISEVYETWRGARQAFSTSMHDQVLNAATMISTPQAPAGQPLRLSDGTWVIVDDDGRQWTRQELEQAIAMRSGAATSIDPLVHQLSNVPEVVNVFRSFPAMAKEYTRHLLKEMQDNNAEIQGKVIDSYEYAFRSGKIREDLPSRTVPGTFIAMQGIHLLAHQAIGDAFEGSNWYAVGIDFAFSAELGRLSLISFAEFGLILTLSVLCPPLGAAAGFVSAEVHYAEAQERMRIYKSVIDPEQLYSKAELELDLFMAELELALSIIPELGSIGRGAVKGATAIGRHGVRGGLVRISVQARRALFVSIGRQAKQGLAKAFVTALVTDRMMALVLPHLLGPVIEGVEAEIRGQTAPPPLAGQAALAGPPPAEEGEEITSPDGIAFLSRLDEYTPGPEEERLPPAEEAP